ncbi:MAG: alanine racemase [Alteromonadaceae bacterium]|nr:alanine racemase [Alteromonadaceae bacterium]
MSRQTQAVIHADALLHNFRVLSSLAGEGQNMAVVKADAYGHGAVNVARILRKVSPAFAVAITEEALALREGGIQAPVVILEGPHQAAECAVAARENCIVVVHSEEQLCWLKACPSDRRPAIWLKVDSGMHRLGFACDEVLPMVAKYRDMLTDDTVLVTHLACGDETGSQSVQKQLDAFEPVRAATGFAVSIANSPGTVGWPQARGNWNRTGIAMYGAEPLDKPCGLDLQPVMTLQASIIALRTIEAGETVGYGDTWQAKRRSVIATAGIGYADGYPRQCPNGTPVMVNGHRAALAGRVSMDMITIDVTDIPAPAPGDRVELWGHQLSVDEVARHAGTISYDLVTRLSQRVPRIVKHV